MAPTRRQAGRGYTGGDIGASFSSGTPSSRATQFLKQLDAVIPGALNAWNGRATIDFWKGYEWTRGS
jgi:monoamine oxidase